MRIGIVSEYVRPWPGGIAEHVHHEAHELAKRGHHVVILSGPGGTDESGATTVRLERELVFTSHRTPARLSIGRSLVHLRKLLASLSLDVLHVHAPLHPVLPLSSVLSAPCPVVGTFHASFRPALPWNALYRTFGTLTGRAMARLFARIAVSAEAERSIARYFPGEYQIVPNGVDLECFRQRPFPSEGPRTILFVGNADPRKGIATLLEAFRFLSLDRHDVRLLLAGVTAEELARVTGGATPENVVALGTLPPALIPDLFAHAHVLCAPSHAGESQGVALLEAMASGRPVVCFDIPGYRELVRHGVEGLVVHEHTPEKLALALLRLLDDAGFRAWTGHKAREKAAHFAWPRVVDAMEEIFRDACESASEIDESARLLPP